MIHPVTETHLKRAALMMEVIPKMMRMIRTEIRKHSEGKLTVPQFRVLNQLVREPSTNHELAHWMGVSAPTMSKMVEALIKRGFVKRKNQKEDRRQIWIECTESGSALAQEIRTLMQKELAGKIATLEEKHLMTIESGLLSMKEFFL